jgi:LacI family transcriptional regulator
MKQRVTQRDIADALNMSHITVSRVFNRRGYISPETRKRVLEYAREVNYRPHKAAQALSRGRIARLAIITTDHPDYFWADIARGLAAAAQQVGPLGIEVVHHQVHRRGRNEFLKAIHEESRAAADVVAVSNTGMFSVKAGLDILAECEIPVVMFNVDSDHPARVSYVGPDYTAAGRLAAEIVSKSLRTPGKVLALQMASKESLDSARLVTGMRYAGFHEELERRTYDCEVDTIDVGPDPDLATITDAVTGRLPAFPGSHLAIYCATSDIVRVANALDELGERSVVLVGHDLAPDLLPLIRNTTITAEISQNPMLQAYLLVKTMQRIAETGPRPELARIVVPSQAVFAANVEDRSSLDLLLAVSEDSQRNFSA